MRARRDAVRLLGWYAMRWRIETFHKILKSGCRAEQARLRTAERLANLLSVLCLVAWRVFWLTTMNRVAPEAVPTVALTEQEIAVLDRCALGSKGSVPPGSLAEHLGKVARLGGYLARSKDPPPGNLVLWRGLSRLADIELGFTLAARLVGD